MAAPSEMKVPRLQSPTRPHKRGGERPRTKDTRGLGDDRVILTHDRKLEEHNLRGD